MDTPLSILLVLVGVLGGLAIWIVIKTSFQRHTQDDSHPPDLETRVDELEEAVAKWGRHIRRQNMRAVRASAPSPLQDDQMEFPIPQPQTHAEKKSELRARLIK